MGGDTRITAVQVPALLEEIPKDILVPALQKEGPAFMRTLMDWHIPEASGRLILPVIETQSKADAIASNRDPLEAFVDDQCYKIPGATVGLQEFTTAFHKTLDALDTSDWSGMVVKAKMSEWFPIGRSKGNVDYIGNLSLTEVEPSEEYEVKDRRLKRKSEE
jgi:hypothetical protein